MSRSCEAPTVDELLDERFDARLAAGCVPIPTATIDGLVILGHACRVSGG